MDRRFFETEKFLSPIGSNWKLPSVRAEPLPVEQLSTATLARLRKNCSSPPTEALHNASRAPVCVTYITTEESKLYVPTGKRHVKKDGSLGAEELIPIPLVKVFANVRHGKKTVFHFRVIQLGATPRATRLADSRTIIGHKPDGKPIYKRVTMEFARSELQRLCPPAMAEATADTLQTFIAE